MRRSSVSSCFAESSVDGKRKPSYPGRRSCSSEPPAGVMATGVPTSMASSPQLALARAVRAAGRDDEVILLRLAQLAGTALGAENGFLQLRQRRRRVGQSGKELLEILVAQQAGAVQHLLDAHEAAERDEAAEVRR
eukprot:scaffold492_cov257-Pinguiococcus_pyrenoidosus.AAC.8